MFEISSSPVRAVIVTPQVMSVPAFVMKSFEPEMTQDPSRSAAVVRVLPASEPAPGLREAERREPLAGGEVGQPALLLLLRAVEQDRHRAEGGVRRDRDRDRRVDARELLDGDGVRDGVGVGAAVLLGDREPHDAELGQLGHELVREARLEVELGGDGCDALPRERTHGVADQLLLGREVEVHARGSYRRDSLPPSTRRGGGSTMASVQEFFEGLPGRVDPERIAGMTNTYIFDIEGAGTWRVAIADGAIEVTEGGNDADVTFSASAENFEKIVAGEQNPTTAYMTGKLKIKGDMGAAMKLQKLF